MGREGRRERREQRRWERWEQEEEQAKEADAFFAKMQWGEGDVLEPKPEATGPDPWRAEQFGTVHQVARLFQVHWKTVEVWRRKHGLPCLREGGVIRYALGDVLRWASARRVGA